MAPDEPSGARPAGPVVLRIKLRYDDVDAMIARFAVNVGKTGLFLPTKSIQPVGTELKFELRIATDQPMLIGVGRVKAARHPDPDDPGAAYGMAVELMRVTRESRELILKMLERRKQLGLVEIGLPMPADVDAARRAEVMESGIKDAGSGAIPQMVTPVLESAPVLTAPRRNTGPLAIAKATSVEPLAPEAPRKKRVPVADLIASASGPIAAPAPIDGLDDNIDVAAALARARALAAGTDLDGELEALRDAAAAPLAEIGVEAASAELARQLGGSAVSKSARWAPPPPTQTRDVEPEVIAREPAAPELPRDVEARDAREPVAPEPAATEIEPPREEPVVEAKEPEAEPEPPAIEARVDLDHERDLDRDISSPVDDAATPVGAPPAPSLIPDDDDEPALFADRQPAFTPESIGTDPAAPMIHDGADPSQFEEEHEVEPEQIHDEMHRLSDSDIEELENTQIGQMPGDGVQENAFDQHAYATVPSDDGAIADRLDQQLDEAENEDMGFVPGEGMQQYSDEPSPFDPSLEAALVAAASAEAVDPAPEEIEEIEDFEIIAEADAEDEDLMHHRAATPMPDDAPARPSFLNRLSLDEESGYHPPAPSQFDDEFAHEPGPVDPRILSAGYALSAFEGEHQTPDPDQDFNAPGTYTPIPREPAVPGEEQFDEFDAPHNNYAGGIALYVPQDAFDQSDVIAIPPARQSPAQQQQDDEDFPDLEQALEALDVDLDDISDPSKAIPRALTGGQRRRNAAASQPTEDARVAKVRKSGPVPGGRTHKRATTEDGIVIDFDDEDE